VCPEDDGVASVNLFASHMIVTGNHVKTSSKNGHSIGLGFADQVAFLANYTTNGHANVTSTVPAVPHDFNIII
jgi:ApbE superfamily uncharacterized protein (UPF0280 family)